MNFVSFCWILFYAKEHITNEKLNVQLAVLVRDLPSSHWKIVIRSREATSPSTIGSSEAGRAPYQASKIGSSQNLNDMVDIRLRLGLVFIVRFKRLASH